MSLKFAPATRQGVKPLIGLSGESNSGKTFSALVLARGIAGPNGKVALIDTESGRGSLYADQVPGGYLRADLSPPFTPGNYVAALDDAEALGADVIVVDSFSHEWEGEGGVVDLAGDNEARSGKSGLHNWKKPKIEHKQLVLRLQRSKAVVIVCLRSMYKSRQVKNNGKTEIVKDPFLTPIQSDGFVFEMTIICEMQRSDPGTFLLTKWSVPDLKQCFPGCGPDAPSKDKLSIAHGAAISDWCRGTASANKAVGTKPTAHPKKSELWALRKPGMTAPEFQQWLWDEMLMDADKTLDALMDEQLTRLVDAVKRKVGQ